MTNEQKIMKRGRTKENLEIDIDLNWIWINLNWFECSDSFFHFFFSFHFPLSLSSNVHPFQEKEVPHHLPGSISLTIEVQLGLGERRRSVFLTVLSVFSPPFPPPFTLAGSSGSLSLPNLNTCQKRLCAWFSFCCIVLVRCCICWQPQWSLPWWPGALDAHLKNAHTKCWSPSWHFWQLPISCTISPQSRRQPARWSAFCRCLKSLFENYPMAELSSLNTMELLIPFRSLWDMCCWVLWQELSFFTSGESSLGLQSSS